MSDPLRLLTTRQAAQKLGLCERSIKRRPIPYIRDGKRRLYLEADIEAYLSDRRVEPCQSSSVRAPRTGKLKSKSEAPGLLEALAQSTSARRANLNATYARSSKRKLALTERN